MLRNYPAMPMVLGPFSLKWDRDTCSALRQTRVEDRWRQQYRHKRRLPAQYTFDEKSNAAIGRGRSCTCPSLFAPPS
jgi:hypothetical protein